MKKINNNNETHYNNYIFYGIKKDNIICFHKYCSLEQLAGFVSRTIFNDKCNKFENLIRNNNLPWQISYVFTQMQGIDRYNRIPYQEIEKIEENSTEWDEAKAKINELLKKYNIKIENEVKNDMNACDKISEMLLTKKNCYRTVVKKSEKGRAIVTYFDNQEDAIISMLRAKFNPSGLLIGDEGIANFIKKDGIARLKKSKNNQPLAAQITKRIIENKWTLPKAYTAINASGKKTLIQKHRSNFQINGIMVQ